MIMSNFKVYSQKQFFRFPVNHSVALFMVYHFLCDVFSIRYIWLMQAFVLNRVWLYDSHWLQLQKNKNKQTASPKTPELAGYFSCTLN